MTGKPEQFTELQRKNMEAAIKLAQMSLENSQRLVAMQADVAKKLLEASVHHAKDVASATDAQQTIGLRTQFAQDTAQMMLATAQEIAALGNTARSEFSHLMTEQLASGSKDMADAFQSFFGSLPGQNATVMDTMQQAMSNANSAFEQIAQAASGAFGMGSQGGAKAGKKAGDQNTEKKTGKT